MKNHWLLPLVALACTAEPPDDTSSSDPPAATSPAPTVPGPVIDTGTSEVDEPAPYIVEEDDLPDVTVDLAEAEGALQDALDLALTVHALPVESSYNAAMSTQGSQCPYYYTTADGTYWFDNCTAESGAEFNGYVFAYGESGVSDGYGGTFDYWQAFGAATVVDPSGHLLEMGGQAYHTTGYGFGFTTYTSVVQGTFAFDGPEGDGTWMGEGIDPDFILYGYRAGEGDDAARLMYVDGGFGGIGDGWAVAFDENQIAEAELGVACPDELSGTVGVRSPEGQWVDVIFQGDAAGGFVPAGGCDGCGDAFVQGELVGTLCVDPTGLVGWGESPW